jgi:hypothetical protein
LNQKCIISIFVGKLLVTTGIPKEAGVKSEVIDLFDSNNVCKDMNDFPHESYGAIGGLLNDIEPLVCGGVNSTIECYVINQNDIQTELLENRHYASSLTLNTSHIWVTGGYDGNNGNITSTTEIISLGQSSVKGPDLPEGVYDHCLAQWVKSTAKSLEKITKKHLQRTLKKNQKMLN